MNALEKQAEALKRAYNEHESALAKKMEETTDTDFVVSLSKLARVLRADFEKMSKKYHKFVQLLRAIMGAQVCMYSYLVLECTGELAKCNRKKRDDAKKSAANEIRYLDKAFYDCYGETLKQAGWNMGSKEKSYDIKDNLNELGNAFARSLTKLLRQAGWSESVQIIEQRFSWQFQKEFECGEERRVVRGKNESHVFDSATGDVQRTEQKKISNETVYFDPND